MKISIKRLLVGAIAGSTAAAGALSMGTTTSANAAVTVTNYGFEGSAFGTYASTGAVGLTSGRTAHAFIGCTRRVGILDERSVASVNVPPGNEFVKIGAVDSFSRTYRLANGEVGNRSQTELASVNLANVGGISLAISGLKARTEAYATKAGKFGTRTSFTSAALDVNLPPELQAIEDALDGLGINNLIKQITTELDGAADDVLVIPGLGEIRLGDKYRRTYYSWAEVTVTALEILVYGADGAKGGTGNNADITVRVGRARSRITRNLPSGVFRGNAYALKATLLNGLLGVGPIGEKRLSCAGTGGVVKENALVDLDLLNQGVVMVEGATGAVYGKQYDTGKAVAWTRGKVAGVKLASGGSSLEIKGIVGRANVTIYRSGTVSKSITGSAIAQILVNGEAQTLPLDRNIEIPGLAKVEFLKREDPNSRTIKVTAVKITLLGDAATDSGLAVIHLGVAEAGVRRS